MFSVLTVTTWLVGLELLPTEPGVVPPVIWAS